LVSPGSTFEPELIKQAVAKGEELGLEITKTSESRNGFPRFLNGAKEDRLHELIAAEKTAADAIWCTRGGCGAIELWHGYEKEFYQSLAPLIGYSDITILHFMRFYRARRIGIHGPVFFDILHSQASFKTLLLLINKQAEAISYPPLKPLNHFLKDRLSGELVVMNLASLQSILGGIDNNFFRGKILAIEDVNEPHYKIFRAFCQLKNTGALAGLKALLLGHLGEHRKTLIDETIGPIASELGLPLFDWPIFGHELPNWPLLFGAKSTINKVDEHFFTLTYDEQHDHQAISHDYF
jgi:muramoyltetrapeptide carboxypeptidase